MIPRYSLPRMAAIWSEENRFQKMLDVEIFACEALAKLGKIPKASLFQIRKKARFNIDRIKEIEAVTNHDVIAFIKNVSEYVGEDAKYIHMGLTSSDVLDTALSVQMQEACDILIDDVKKLMRIIAGKARRYKKTLMIGRTHSVHAEPMTFGLKMALYYDEMSRNLERLKRARSAVSVGKISGAVGTYANIDPSVEAYVCKKLGLKPANVATQVVQRDHHAEFLVAIALTGTSLEKFATEFRNLQHTEIGEVEEFFSKGQKGSSAMPHKKNPIMCERISGLARILRANSIAAMEDIVLWHERDISHSSVERVILPDSTILLDYMLNKFMDVVSHLVVNEDRMLENLNRSGGIVFSGKLLLELIEKGLTRNEAYDKVQEVAFAARQGNIGLKEALLKDDGIRSLLSVQDIEKIFDYGYHIKNVDRIFKQVGI
ncbi:MAG: adenylosuccinate lyase [Candidatus Omnitrophica bacterium]|nr:adenylosuccinate lyase [Candidatus Omnitrophota bacterium]MCM8791210.1 adenylosuccinate lyase [Candidatus Omnitrophota bacterium]